MIDLTDNTLINNMLIHNLCITNNILKDRGLYTVPLWKSNYIDGVECGIGTTVYMKKVYIEFRHTIGKFPIHDIQFLVKFNMAAFQYKYELKNDEFILYKGVNNQYEFETIKEFVKLLDYSIIPTLKMLNIIFNDAFITNIEEEEADEDGVSKLDMKGLENAIQEATGLYTNALSGMINKVFDKIFKKSP